MAPKSQPATEALLQRAHSPATASRILSDKIQHRPLLLKASEPAAQDAREARRRARQKQAATTRRKARKPAPLTARERRARGLYDVPRAALRYAAFEPLHRLWLGYVRDVLGRDLYALPDGAANANAAVKLSSADFHGAELEVVRSRCVGRVGIRGIVIKDARFVFELVTRGNALKVVPKEGTMFRVEVPAPESHVQGEGADGHTTAAGRGSDDKTGEASDGRPKMVFEIRGDMFLHRSADRATKKFKNHFLEDA